MQLYESVSHLQRPLHTEMVKAHNAGRAGDEHACRNSLNRLVAVEATDPSNPAFITVTGEAQRLLDQLWTKRRPTVRTAPGGATGD